MNSADNNKIAKDIRDNIGPLAKIVFISGNFNVLHPGHLRLLKFASENGDYLVVGVNSEVPNKNFTLLADLRLEAVQASRFVDYAFLLPTNELDFISALQPDIIVKGKEYEGRFNPELDIVNKYDGKILFSSGEVTFSSTDLIDSELNTITHSEIHKPFDFTNRYQFSAANLTILVDQFAQLKIIIFGDLIVDEYINCSPLGMSREDPTLVVTPLETKSFVGGAGIVASHAAKLGAKTHLVSVCNDDPSFHFAKSKLEEFGVFAEFVIDPSRPTTLKKRYRADGKTLLRVSELRHHDIGEDIINAVLEKLRPLIVGCDLFIFSDFNYGCCPNALLEKITSLCSDHNVMMVADSQSSSQQGDISRFQNMALVTPTEYEARLALQDFNSGLVIVAENLVKKSRAKNVFVTLGKSGLLIYYYSDEAKDWLTDQLPAFHHNPVDVSGAGDCLLVTAAMALALKAPIYQAAYLGSVAAACQVSRVGNTPLTADELKTELNF